MICIGAQNNQLDANKGKKRNSLLELYRFLFSVWVVWYHGYFAFQNQYFDHGYIAVEFFFILSGFYLLKSINKYQGETFWRGLWKLLWGKVKPLGLTFAVGVVFVYVHMFLEGKPVLFGYLWYIPIMLLCFAVVYVLKRLIKNKTAFVLCIVAIAVVSYLILYLPIVEKLGVARGFGAVSLGVLTSLIPKKNFATKHFDFNWAITSVIISVVILLAYLPESDLVSDYLLVLLILPMLVYFTSTLKVNIKLFNFLGSLSFAIYSYQCVLRVLRYIYPSAQNWFLPLLILLVMEDKLLVQWRKQMKPSYNLRHA